MTDPFPDPATERYEPMTNRDSELLAHVDETLLYDNVKIESGAMTVEGKTFPLLKFTFSTSNESNPPIPILFVGTPSVLDNIRRLLRDAVRIAIAHAHARSRMN